MDNDVPKIGPREISTNPAADRQREPPPPAEAVAAAAEPDTLALETERVPHPIRLVVNPEASSEAAKAGGDAEGEDEVTGDEEQEKFAVKQRLALEVLARGGTVRAAAEAAGVHRASVHRWLQDPAFVKERERRVQQRRDRIRAKVVAIGDLGLEKLEEALKDESEPNRVAVLRLALKIGGHL